MGNETTVKEMTNLERMKSGKSPAILVCDKNGNTMYDKVELHHLTSTERNRGSKYFNGIEKDGSLVEIQSSLHDRYKKQLHSINENHNSFRKTTATVIDDSGHTIRYKTTTIDAVQYNKFRSQYWIDRANEIIQQRENGSSETANAISQIEEGGKTMAKSWELTPEEKQKAIQGQQKAAEKWSKKSTTSSGNDEGKGQRERDRSDNKRQSR